MNDTAQRVRQPDAKLRPALRAWPQFGVGLLRLTLGLNSTRHTTSHNGEPQEISHVTQRIGATIVMACLAAGCVTTEPLVIPFDSSEFDSYDVRGEGQIRGSAFVKFASGATANCANESVFLAPGTSYIRKVDNAIRQSNPKPGLASFLSRYQDSSQPNALRKAVCDENGEFEFDQLPAGEWYVLTRVRTGSKEFSISGGYSYLTQFVSLAPGETQKITLTYRDAHFQYD
jgi:hypothetical protein